MSPNNNSSFPRHPVREWPARRNAAEEPRPEPSREGNHHRRGYDHWEPATNPNRMPLGPRRGEAPRGRYNSYRPERAGPAPREHRVQSRPPPPPPGTPPREAFFHGRPEQQRPRRLPPVNPFEGSRPHAPIPAPPKPTNPLPPMKKKAYIPSRPVGKVNPPLAPEAAGVMRTSPKKGKEAPGPRSAWKKTAASAAVKMAEIPRPKVSPLSSEDSSPLSSLLSSPPASLEGSPPPKKVSPVTKKTSAPAKKNLSATKKQSAPAKKPSLPAKKPAPPPKKPAPPKITLKDPSLIERHLYKVKYQEFPVSQLRLWCTERNLPTPGTKVSLINRLWSDDREYGFYSTRDYTQNSVPYLLIQAQRCNLTTTPAAVIADLMKADKLNDENKRVDEYKSVQDMSLEELREEARNYDMPTLLLEHANHIDLCTWVAAYSYYSMLDEAERKVHVRDRFGGIWVRKPKGVQCGILATEHFKMCVVKRAGLWGVDLNEVVEAAGKMGVEVRGDIGVFDVVWAMGKGEEEKIADEKKMSGVGKKRGREEDEEESCGSGGKKARVEELPNEFSI